MCIEIHNNQSILEIIKYYHSFEDIDISKVERQGYKGMGYSYDCCEHYEPDEYCLTKKELKRFKSYHIDAQFIVELETFMKEECFNCTFMSTNKKFGLVDYANTPVSMGINKNICTKVHNYLYDNTKWYKSIVHFKWKIDSIKRKLKKLKKR